MPSSLGGRLVLGSALIVLLAVVVTLVTMDRVFDRFVTGQIDQRLDNKLLALASQVKVAADGTISLAGNADGPPFDMPRHDSFWFVGGPRNVVETSWLRQGDVTLPTPAEIEAAPGPPPRPPDDPLAHGPDTAARTLTMAGPHGTLMHARISRRTIDGTSVILGAAAPLEAIDGPMREALKTVATVVLTLGIALLATAFWLVRIGLSPLTRLRSEVADVRTGRATALSPNQPAEIQPLVSELNSLLAQNAENLARARRHVANLAHGLKTPLATLSLTVDRLGGEERDSMRLLVGAIDRRVRHHLGRARAAAIEGPARMQTPLGARLSDIVDTLQKIHAEKGVTCSLACAADIVLACEPQDVDEMLGNLLENAFKYTSGEVVCRAVAADAQAVITIADDGPGLAAAEIDRVLRPGERLDEAVPGHGFGLPIAREVAELYGGSLALASTGSGLEVTLRLPRVQ